ncbi:MAG: lamin tail domain-containing protein [Bacteroidales bacterium]|nr:lamin tail domain-containing protein [Bacteroidales bacterium]
MKVKRIIFTLAAILVSTAALRAQNVIDLIISEALAEPDSTVIMDDFGGRSGWIEIFNTSQGTVNLGGCYLTDDLNNLRKSLIPKTDNRVQLGPRQVLLFYATGNGDQGTFYTSFRVRPGSTIYLVSNDGRTIVDSIEIPANLPKGKSVSKFAYDNKQMVFETSAEPTNPTPRILNGSLNVESNAQRMARTDPHGFILSLVAVTVVFSALAILWFFFWLLFDRPAKQKAKMKDQPVKEKKKKAAPLMAAGKLPDEEVAAAIAMAFDLEQGGDTFAAIAMALHLYLTESVHDNESFILTIQPTPASGWNDKFQKFRKLPR